jgi:hypothetical protein
MFDRMLFTRTKGSAIAAVLVLFFLVLGCNTKSDDEWTALLAHKKLSRANNDGSISTKVNYYFCPSGEYAIQTQFSGFSTGGAGTLSMADEDVELGTWQVRNGVLLLSPQDGGRKEISLSQGLDADVIQLDGTGHLIETHNECQ